MTHDKTEFPPPLFFFFFESQIFYYSSLYIINAYSNIVGLSIQDARNALSAAGKASCQPSLIPPVAEISDSDDHQRAGMGGEGRVWMGEGMGHFLISSLLPWAFPALIKGLLSLAQIRINMYMTQIASLYKLIGPVF